MEPKVFVYIIVFLFGVSDSKREKCAVKRKDCDKPSFLRRYYFNETKRRCSSFYTCRGEGDNFYPRMMECVRDCKPKQKPTKCYDEKARRCRGDMPGETVWSYDLTKKRCDRAENVCYSTKNKFVSEEQCLAECFGFGRKGLLQKYKKSKKPSTPKKEKKSAKKGD
ncbi:inter-alpha-trypsin inhibitor-like [Ornithodoros turicata]|uniref:inter-alpha-trypsin inhibitor-like n=1 Tax=Ornithodoros turicata TaxID=34597 RepID=UPI003138AD6C